MTKVDWSKAPDGAQYYASKAYWKCNKDVCGYLVSVDGVWIDSTTTRAFAHSPFFYDDVQSKADHIVDANKKVWPSESRIDIIGTNGNTGESYMEETLHQTAKVHYETQSELAARLKAELEAKQKAEAKQKTITTASDFLSEGLRILSERGKQYDPSGTKEMSFDNVAEAFNCLTNSRLKGSDVCLILALLKVVRQNANKSFHEDSAVDFVNYAALYSEILKGEK